MTHPFRIAILNSHPIQYFAPLYAVLTESGIEVTALYCSDFSLRGGHDPGFGQNVAWDVDLLSGYRSIFLGEAAKRRTPAGFWSLICPEVWGVLRGGSYDAVVLHGYGFAVNLLAFAAAKSKGIPVLMRSETHLGLRGRRWKHWVRDRVLSIAYRFVDGFLAIGTANRTYYRALGVPESKIHLVPYSVDNDRFMEAAVLSADERAAVRREYGLPENGVVVLYASKLTRRKHPEDVMRAVAKINRLGLQEVTLFLVGSGELEQELRSLQRELGVSRVVYGGFVNQAKLPRIYAACDLFVLPSEHEPWGLIVNEVLCAALPVVVSDEVGCVADLVHDGVNGFHMRANDLESLVAAMTKVASDPTRRREMGNAGLGLIRKWSYTQCKEGFLSALRSCAAGRRASCDREGAADRLSKNGR